MISDTFCWTSKGIEYYKQKLPKDLWASNHAEEGMPICNEILVQILADGDTPKSMLKRKFASGKPSSAPPKLLEIQDQWQDLLLWPAEPTADEVPLLDELKMAVAPSLEGLACADWEDVTGSIRLLRFLRGFEFHVPSAALAFRRMLEVRRDYSMDASHDKAIEINAATGPFGELLPTDKSADIHKHMPWMRMGVAQGGARGIGPVHYLPLARISFDGFYAADCADNFFEHHTVCQQAGAYELQQLSKERGVMVKTAMILDMQGGGMSNLRHRQFDKQFKPEQERIDKGMAEAVGVIFMVNMPTWLQPLFNLMKRVMPARTLAKLQHVPRGKEAQTLLPIIGPEVWQRICAQRAESEADRDPSTFHISAGRTCSRTIVACPGQTVHWAFSVEVRDIDFEAKLYRQSELGETQELASPVELRRVSSTEGSVDGKFCVQANVDGAEPTTQVLLEFIWSNLHSYMRSKTVCGVTIVVDGAECMPTPQD